MNPLDHDLPPMIDGVSASRIYLPPISALEDHDKQATVFAFLKNKFAHISAAEWRRRFVQQLVLDSKGQPLSIDSPYLPAATIFYYRMLAHEAEVPFKEKILFENEDYMVVDKPHFLTVSPTGQYVKQTLLTRLKLQTENQMLSPIHRLDRETAGVILFSKRSETRSVYQQLFATRQVSKQYIAIAKYKSQLINDQSVALRMEKGEPFYRMQIVAGQVNSQTTLKMIEKNGHQAKYLLSPITGKQHQLRVHMNYLGCPIKFDRIYPHINHHSANDFQSPLQLLALGIRFFDPIRGQHMQFQSEQNLLW